MSGRLEIARLDKDRAIRFKNFPVDKLPCRGVNRVAMFCDQWHQIFFGGIKLFSQSRQRNPAKDTFLIDIGHQGCRIRRVIPAFQPGERNHCYPARIIVCRLCLP